jgi:peptide/nickel transport system ATP-binding protein
MAHKVALMYAGQIVETAATDEFFARPLHPYAQMLFAALPDTGKRGRPLAAIAGTVPRLDREFGCCRFADRCPLAFDDCRRAPPPLFEPLAAHQVRCLLHREAAVAAPGPGVAAAAEPQGAGVGAMEPGGGPLLDVRDYKVWFPIRKGLLKRTVGYVRAVDGVSFSIAPARSLALVGESGCGKTTIGKGILQLLRGLARIEGEALLDGQRLDRLDGEALRRARREVQIIFQDPFASLNPRMRVAEIMAEGVASLRPEIGPVERRERVVALLQKVGLHADAVDRYPHEFSGGQRQRIAIARALAVEPRLIICDEPTSALDVSVQAQILNLLAQLQRELGVAYLFITHNFGVVEYLAHDIAVMQAGRIVEAGPAERILEDPQHAYTQTLLAAVPRLARAA